MRELKPSVNIPGPLNAIGNIYLPSGGINISGNGVSIEGNYFELVNCAASAFTFSQDQLQTVSSQLSNHAATMDGIIAEGRRNVESNQAAIDRCQAEISATKARQEQMKLLIQEQQASIGKLLEEINETIVADLNKQDVDGNTSLMKAVMQDNKLAFDFLLQHHANLEIENDKGNTALHLSIIKRNIDFAKKLISAGAELDHIADHKTALDLARESSPELAEYLISLGAHSASELEATANPLGGIGVDLSVVDAAMAALGLDSGIDAGGPSH